MSANPIAPLTDAEYLKLDRAAEFKSEFYNGRMYAMSGGTYLHGQIIPNLARALLNALSETSCTLTSSEVRLRVAPGGLYAYPDVMVVCGNLKFADDQDDTLLNPTLVAEVLSSSTEGYDRGLKFAQYRPVESLREYVLVSQTEPRVEKFLRQASGDWLWSESTGLESVCRLESVACTIPLSGIYQKVKFRAAG